MSHGDHISEIPIDQRTKTAGMLQKELCPLHCLPGYSTVHMVVVVPGTAACMGLNCSTKHSHICAYGAVPSLEPHSLFSQLTGRGNIVVINASIIIIFNI